ncbi:hypothetical protein H0H93_011307 [Arthromyces matolae]|nr:hypothetical protein H0H93_011307 [Arthromyces matolae]
MDNELISNAQENVPVAAVDDDHDAILSFPPYSVILLGWLFRLEKCRGRLGVSIVPAIWVIVTSIFSAARHIEASLSSDGSLPYASATVSSLVPQQSYDISVHLDIPAVENNFALGNFMTTLTLSTPSNKTLVSARRTAIVFPPKTSVFYRNPGTVRVVIPMVSSFVTSSSTIVAYVEIGRQDQWKSLGTGEGREVSVITASVQGSVVRGGLRDAEDDEIATPSPSASDVDAKPSMRRKGKSKPSGSRSARTKFKRESPTSSRDPTRITSVRRRILRPSGGLANSDQDM